MTQTTANQHPRDRMRGRIDRGVQAAVTASGLMVLMTLMLIFGLSRVPPPLLRRVQG